MIIFVGLRAKINSYLIDDAKKAQKTCVIKRKFKFEKYENCVEGTQLKNKVNHLEINKTDIKKIMQNS